MRNIHLFASVLLFLPFSVESANVIGKIDRKNRIISRCDGITKEYLIPEAKLSYNAARRFCKQIAMELISVQSACETNAVNNYLRQYEDAGNEAQDFWMGGDRIGETDITKFYWQSTGKPIQGYTNWNEALGEPNNGIKTEGGEACMELVKVDKGSYKWNDLRCFWEMNFVCESQLMTSQLNNYEEIVVRNLPS